MVTYSRFSSLALAALIAAFSAPAGALQITGLVLANTSTANQTTNSGQTQSEDLSATSVVLAPGGPVSLEGQTTSFLARYASLLSIDRQNTSGATVTNDMTSTWKVTFTVDNPSGASYQLDLDTSRVGALTNVNDATGAGQDGSSTIGAVTGMLDGFVNANLALTAVGPFTSAVTAVSVINQSSTTLSIIDQALSRTFVLDFTWTGSSSSHYDEAAIRLGLTGSLSSMSADDYPGVAPVGPRTQANDGHFLDVTITLLTPEPEPLVLVTLGLLGLASASRRARIAGKRARR